MYFSKEQILADLRALGIKSGDNVLLHTSLSKVGMVERGPEGFVEAILNAVGQEGLAVFPTFTGTREDSKKKPPYFDVVKTPAWTGKVPETARVFNEAIRSLHPTHSVAAIGENAKRLTKGHEYVLTPCGEGSPFVVLAENKGKILLVGVDHNSNTTFHTAEEYAKCPFHMLDEPALATIVDYERKTRQVVVNLHRWGTERNFNLLEEEFLLQGIEKIGRIGQAKCRLIEAAPMIEIIVSYLVKEPYYLVVKG